MSELDPLLCRRALEALRAGVPNRDAVRLLPPLHRRPQDAFDAVLLDTENRADGAGRARGLLVTGGFGSGKSHLLEALRHTALENQFVCSRVVLSKEVPLSDPIKVLRAAVASATLPDRPGTALTEIVESFVAKDAPGWAEFYQWSQRTPELDPRLAASVTLFERLASVDEEMVEKIQAEWLGFGMKVSELRAALKTLGTEPTHEIGGRIARDQEWQRFAFFSRLFRAVGYTGWIVLLDEAELVARYSVRQRGRAYANLARLLGVVDTIRIPGFAAVAAITDDFAGEVLNRRGDRTKVAEKMALTEPDDMSRDCVRGMDTIERTLLSVQTPSAAQVEQTQAHLRAIYAAAYASPTPALPDAVEYAGSTRMRQYIRAWITLWDLRRIYGYEGHAIAETVALSYEEDADMEKIQPDGE